MATPRDIDEHSWRLARHFTVALPEGAGPHPVVIQLHGCGGRQPLHDRYARVANDAGVASVVVVSFAPRNIHRRVAQMAVCTGLHLRGAERAGDLVAALHWLEGQPWADMDRVAAAGWSHGGWTVMDALAGAYGPANVAASRPELLKTLKAAFLVYPYAGVPSLTLARGWGSHAPKVTAVLGGKDAVVGHRLPRRALDRLKADGLDVDVTLLDDATHGFDDPDADDPRTRYDPAHTATAEALFARSLEAVRA